MYRIRESRPSQHYEIIDNNEQVVGKLTRMNNQILKLRLNQNNNEPVPEDLRMLIEDADGRFETLMQAIIAITGELNLQLADFLNNSVYYPCSGLHEKPLEILGSLSPNFLYADNGVDFENVQNNKRLSCGYCRINFEDLEPTDLHLIEKRGDERATFVALSHFERLSENSDEHGPNQIHLVFTGGEGVNTYATVYNIRVVAPTCLVHICPGQGFVENYCENLALAMEENLEGLPKYLLIDEAGCNADTQYYLRTVESYTPLRYWNCYNGIDEREGICILAVRQQPAPTEGELEVILEKLPDGTDCIGKPWTDFQEIL